MRQYRLVEKLKKIYPIYSILMGIALSVLWGISAGQKMFNEETFAYKINSYDMPFINSNLFAKLTIVIELLIAVSFALSLYPGKIFSIALLFIYISLIISLWMRGIYVSCGCFSLNKDKYGSAVAAGYPKDIARDILIILATISVLPNRNRFRNEQKTS